MQGRNPAALVAALALTFLIGCDPPFFISEEDLRNVLGTGDFLYGFALDDIATYEIADSGGLDLVQGPFGALGAPEAPLATSDGHRLFVNQGALPYEIQVYDVAGDGTLSLAEQEPISGRVRTGVVTSDDRFLYYHRAFSSTIEGWAIDSKTGALTYLGSSSPFGTACLATIVAAPRPDILHVGVTSGDGIIGYQIDPNTGLLTRIPGTLYNMTGAIGVADPKGDYLFTATEIATPRLVTMLGVDVGGGLTFLDQYDFGTPQGRAVAIDPAGNFFFLATDDSKIWSFAIDRATQSLPLADTLLLSGAALSLQMAPSGGTLYATLFGLNQVAVIDVAGDGTLSLVDTVPTTSDYRLLSSRRR